MILIFGGTGFIGSYLTKHLQIKKEKFIVISNNKSIYIDNKYFINSFSYENIRKVIIKFKPSVVLNLHAQTDIERSYIDPLYDLDHNVSLSLKILQSIKELKIKTSYIFIGTATQVGYTDIKKPINMNFHSNPTSIHDLNKQYVENFISIFKKKMNISATTIRLANVIGEGKSRSKSRGVINKIISQAKKNKKISIYGNGKFMRDFIHIDDVVEGLWLICKNIKKLNDPYYYLCTGKGFTFIEILKMIKKIFKDEHNIKININKKNWPINSNIIEKRSFIGNGRSLYKILKWKPNNIDINSLSRIIKNSI